MPTPEPENPLTTALPAMEWLHSHSTEHGVPFLGAIVHELLRSHPNEMLRAFERIGVQIMVPIVEQDLLPKSAIVQAFVAARARQPAEVTAEAEEVLAEVGQQIEELWERLERS